jgi:hypothetical protein
MSKKTVTQVIQELDAPIPRSAVSEREGAGRRTFSYLQAHYVIDRANKVFGQLNWSSETVENRPVFEGKVPNSYGKEKYSVSYLARVRVEFQAEDENGQIRRTSHMGTGYGDGDDATNPGKAHELAMKEAESDALKRALKNAGMSMGLALYDKDQTNVADEPVSTSAQKSSVSKVAQEAPDAGNPAPAPAQAPAASRPSAKGAHDDRPKLAGNRELVNKNIASLAKIVNSQGRKTFAQMKEDMQAKYGTAEKEKLTDVQAEELLAELKKLAG